MGMGAATGAAMGAATSAPTDTVEGEKSRFRRFSEDAVMTNSPVMLLGAPVAGGQYGIGYKDNRGVNRAFIVPVAVAEGLAQAILQEIAADRKAKERENLIVALSHAVVNLRSGDDLETVSDEIVAAINKAA